MSTVNNTIEHVVELFSEQPCWMIGPLAKKLQYSVPSVRRFLVEAGYFSSFTDNGKWYTLSSIPEFDNDDLWFSRNIGFSRHGSLTNTLINAINQSPSGASADNLGQTLHCRCHSILVRLCRQGKLQRERYGRSYIYFAADSNIADTQRQVLEIESTPSSPLPAEIAVLILVEFIRTPHLSFAQLAGVLKRSKGVVVQISNIRLLFAQHGLKKTIRKAVPKRGKR